MSNKETTKPQELTTDQEVQEPMTNQESQEPAAQDLTINDLVSLKNIVEVASQRGAFRAAEMEHVGKTFNKLNAFLELVSQQKKGE